MAEVKINLWDRIEHILAQYGLLDRAKEKWGKRLNEKEYKKAVKWLEEKRPKEEFSKLCEPMKYDMAGGFWHGYRFLQLAAYGVSKVFHPGTDYNLGSGNQDFGLPIWAIADGVVTYKGWGRGWGWHMFIVHDLNHPKYGKIRVWSHYAHLQYQPSLAVGAQVKCGQTIARCGGTGGWSSHLHHELRKRTLGVGFFPYGWSKKQVKEAYYNPETFFIS